MNLTYVFYHNNNFIKFIESDAISKIIKNKNTPSEYEFYSKLNLSNINKYIQEFKAYKKYLEMLQCKDIDLLFNEYIPNDLVVEFTKNILKESNEHNISIAQVLNDKLIGYINSSTNEFNDIESIIALQNSLINECIISKDNYLYYKSQIDYTKLNNQDATLLILLDYCYNNLNEFNNQNFSDNDNTKIKIQLNKIANDSFMEKFSLDLNDANFKQNYKDTDIMLNDKIILGKNCLFDFTDDSLISSNDNILVETHQIAS